jgi:acyl dehydratase
MGAPLTALVPAPARPLRAYASLLLRPRRGLETDGRMPAIGRATGLVKIQPQWLSTYRLLVGLHDEPAVLPPLALQMAASHLHLGIFADKHFPFRAFSLVPMSQRIDQVASVMPGSVVKIESFTGKTQPVRWGTRFDLITEVRREGRLVWRSIMGILARHGTHDNHAANDRERPSGRRAEVDPLACMPATPPVAENVSAPVPLSAFSVLDEGLSLQTAGWQRIEQIEAPSDLGRRYAAIAGDWNPVHRRAWLARRFGFERAIVHGTWTLARGLACAGWPLHEAYSLHAQYRKPVLLPSSVAAWVQCGSALQWLRMTDGVGATEHVVARLEPAFSSARWPSR